MTDLDAEIKEWLAFATKHPDAVVPPLHPVAIDFDNIPVRNLPNGEY